eukprot:PhM_4_TR132/c0_g1_i1/m.57794
MTSESVEMPHVSDSERAGLTSSNNNNNNAINSSTSESYEPRSPAAYTRLKYAWYIFFAFLLCLLFKDGMWGALHSIPFLRHGCDVNDMVPGHETLRDMCLGHTLVYRVSLCLFLFFAIHYVLASDLTCCMDTDTRIVIQEKFFCIKSGLLVLLFFCNNGD